VQRYVDRMLVIFPFEEGFYRERGVDAKFVGHPLADLALPGISRAEFARGNGLDAAKTWIGLLPGSRAKEIRLNLPEMLRAGVYLWHNHDEKGEATPQFILPIAPTLTKSQRAEVQKIVEQAAMPIEVRHRMNAIAIDDRISTAG